MFNRRDKDSAFEFGILALLFVVVIIITIFGLMSPVNARAPQTKADAQRIDMILRHLSTLVNKPITMAQLAHYSVSIYPYAKVVSECPNSVYYPIQGYKITFTYKGVAFDYRIDFNNALITLCHVGV
jgi:hypothetical protein